VAPSGVWVPDRFIPTRVGNTPARRAISASATVHPHASGEHSLALRSLAVLSGSSPREWGTPCHRRWRPPRCRFIPTRVGNTGSQPAAGWPVPVHPHASGEHRSRLPAPRPVLGSSPREWGTHGVWRQRLGHVRFIPTRVGNTGQPVRTVLNTPVHPHASGEHVCRATGGEEAAGSSPREWGTRWLLKQMWFHRRFIPTRVGNTGRSTVKHLPGTVHPHASGEHC